LVADIAGETEDSPAIRQTAIPGTKKPGAPWWRAGFREVVASDYLAETGAGAGAGAALGQQEAANKEATAAITRSLTIFMIVVGGVVFRVCPEMKSDAGPSSRQEFPRKHSFPGTHFPEMAAGLRRP
jgi:hypothetical protein